ncbi:MAG: DUF2339 domain-containing protein, partial [Verrucomicrobiales bacterium]
AKLNQANKELRLTLDRLEKRLDHPDHTNDPAKTPEPPAPQPVPEPTAHTAPATPPTPAPAVLAREPQPETSPTNPAATPATPSPKPPPIPASRPAPAPAPAPATPSRLSRIPWRDILKQLHLLPPTRAGETAESHLAAWWATRIGLILLIIAAVFFGIHVSLRTPPWLRVVTLTAVAAGTIWLGARLKGELRNFGRAITAGGFALLYVTAFAAFALPATKVITSPAAGVLAQLAALAIALAGSLWKRDQVIATLTVILGFVSVVFSHSHGLDHFTLTGTLLLAATGSAFLAARGWLTTFISSLACAWAALTWFSIFDRIIRDAPGFPVLIATIVSLTVIFHAGLSIRKLIQPTGLSATRHRALALTNTSAAAALGYLIIRLAHPTQLEPFYFTTAALLFGLAALHHFRLPDRPLAETLFLKASALLCLGFATALDGPARWIAIAFQALSLLWTAKRSGSRWIAYGFAILVTVSGAWFWHDLAVSPPAEWSWRDPFHIIGSLFLIFLTGTIALHARWFADGIGGHSAKHQRQARLFRIIAALAIGGSALALACTPFPPENAAPVWFLLALSSAIALLTPVFRKPVPCVAAAIPLVSTYLGYASISPTAGTIHSAIILGPLLIALTFAIAELARRFWPAATPAAGHLRSASHLAGLATLLPTTTFISHQLSLAGNTTLLLFALFPLLATAILLARYAKPGGSGASHSTAATPTVLFHLATGLLVNAGALTIAAASPYLPAALALASVPLLATLFRTRHATSATAGAVPFLSATFLFWNQLIFATTTNTAALITNLAVVTGLAATIATILWKRTTATQPTTLVTADALLHSIVILSLHFFYQHQLQPAHALLADTLTGLALFIISIPAPFRSLAHASWLAPALGCLVALANFTHYWNPDHSPAAAAAGIALLLHLLLYHHLRKNHQPAPGSARAGEILARTIPAIPALGWTLLVLLFVDDPWHPASLSAIALLSSSLWKFRNIPTIGFIGLLPLTIAAITTMAHMLAHILIKYNNDAVLTNALITTAALAANGILLATPKSPKPLAALHASPALLVPFTAFATDDLVSQNLTAVFWGASAIALFITGLFARLRSYRLTGLAGLVCCIAHIFIWDIQDTFYRIIAFFGVGIVVLAVGFLYHRFRDRISPPVS